MSNKAYNIGRYRLEPYRGHKTRHTCPQCKKAGKFSRYIDRQTGLFLADNVGKCNRLDNCGYHFTPRQYFEQTPAALQSVQHTQAQVKPESARRPIEIPAEYFQPSLKGYGANNFVKFLCRLFGEARALELAALYHLGTSNAIWPGACIFWLVDRTGRTFAGQVFDFDPATGKTIRETGADGRERRRSNWVHYAIDRSLKAQGKPAPAWLKTYIEQAARFPFCFGLHQLSDSNDRRPVAVVESAKTCLIMTGFEPSAVWLAVGSLSYLNAERLAPAKNRTIILYPDKGCFQAWELKASELRAAGFVVAVSDFLERHTDARAKDDIADLYIRATLAPNAPQSAQERPTASEPPQHTTEPPQPATAPGNGLPDNFARVGETLEFNGLPIAWLNAEEVAEAVAAAPHLALEILAAASPAAGTLIDRFGLECDA